MQNTILLHNLQGESLILDFSHFLSVEEFTDDKVGKYSHITILKSVKPNMSFQVIETSEEIINLLNDNFILLHSIAIEKNPIILNSSHFLSVEEFTDDIVGKYSYINILESVELNKFFMVDETPEKIFHLLNTN